MKTPSVVLTTIALLHDFKLTVAPTRTPNDIEGEINTHAQIDAAAYVLSHGLTVEQANDAFGKDKDCAASAQEAATWLNEDILDNDRLLGWFRSLNGINPTPAAAPVPEVPAETGEGAPAALIILIAFMLSLVFGGSGCASFENATPQGKVDQTASLVEIAAYNGTLLALNEHPDWQAGFQQAHDDLAKLETLDKVSIADLMAIVGRLPIKELHSLQAQLIITNGTMLLSDLSRPGSPLDLSTVNLKPIATALREGIERGELFK